MKRIYSLCMFMCFAFSMQSQEIPNGNFETWGLYNTWNYSPESWANSNWQLMAKVTIDSMSYEGEKAMKVETGAFNEYGFARLGMSINSVPEKLEFYAKAGFEGFPGMSVNTSFFHQGEWVTGAYWGPNEAISEWTLVELFMPVGEVDFVVDSVEIAVECISGDFVYGEGWLSIDAMSFSTVQSQSEFENLYSLNLFPNPSQDRINIETGGFIPHSMEILDMSGRLIKQSRFEKMVQVKDLESGFYFLRILNDEGAICTKRFEKY